MGVIVTNDFSKIKKEELNQLYGNSRDYAAAFENSYAVVFALDEKKLIGAARVLSEGVETALVVDLRVQKEYQSPENAVKKQLVHYLEEGLMNRRVMVYGEREDLDFWEAVGYGRCKNAWTYFRPELSEGGFLPAGYQFENEFLSNEKLGKPVKKQPQNVEIRYHAGIEGTSYEAINELLTKAFWGRPHQVERTRQAFENSSYAIAAYDGARLVGVARAVSDGTHYATILNVAVDPQYQGLSIGRRLVVGLAEQISAEVIVLNTHPGAAGFYNRITEYRRNKYVFEKQTGGNPEKAMDPERRKEMFTPKGYRFPEEYD